MPYLAYHEPGIISILSLTSFLLVLNVIRYILDQTLYCGIVGEILVGVIWGLPVGGTSWLSEGTQETIQAFGYLGLIGLVFEGGLNTDLTLLRENMMMSVSVATLGLLAPIGLSFILLVIPFSNGTETLHPTPLAGFSAGASLCSTSLGTTFSILSSVGIQKSRVGTILIGAAMMDDVVGLVMVNIVASLGEGKIGGWPAARPIVASFGILLVTFVLLRFILGPLWAAAARYVENSSNGLGEQVGGNPSHSLHRTIAKLVHRIPHLGFILSTFVLLVFVIIAAFIDASVLFAAFVAGGVVGKLGGIQQETRETSPARAPLTSATDMYRTYFRPSMEFVLVPFFFASIGFSIPITDMFRGAVIWKGVLYAILMTIAKGLVAAVFYAEFFIKKWQMKRLPSPSKSAGHPQPKASPPVPGVLQPGPQHINNRNETENIETEPPHTTAMLVACAMVSRGEIGFLIASLSLASGTLNLGQSTNLSQSSSEELFLVLIWAVTICTIVGPIAVGIIVNRSKQKAAS